MASFFAAHPALTVLLGQILVIVLGAVYNWISYKRTPEEWAAYELANPRLAAFVRFMRAVFPHLRKIPQINALLPKETE